LVKKYGFESLEDMRRFFGNQRRVLDAGCGAGFSSSAWLSENWRVYPHAEWFGVDISKAIDVAQANLGKIPGTHFIQADLLDLPFRDECFDVIFSEGVLHHTPSTKAALKSLVDVLADDGELLFYIYRKKGAIREFTDDYIREVVSEMPETEAWDALKPLTLLGKNLHDLKVEVEVEEDIPFLGIQKGVYPVQRLFYWFVAKMYWREDLSFEENHHINFDWYHPKYAHRHTEAEIRSWCDEFGLQVTRLHEQPSGYTIRAKRI
jgi:SAM-dependent methyltransferase